MTNTPQGIVGEWMTVLGRSPVVGAEDPGRELWPVTAEDGRQFFLKRLGQWRNLPVAEEARVLQYLDQCQIPVAVFLPTDQGAVFAGQSADGYVLMPRLASDLFSPAELVTVEGEVGASLADLHAALAAYPQSANSYMEDIAANLAGNLTLPPDITTAYERHRKETIASLPLLPVQLVHGDLTPDNVLLRRPHSVAGFIDFDHLPLAPRVWDIARYLSRRVRLRWRQDTPLTEVGRLDHTSGLVSGYTQRSPLSGPELAAIPGLILANNVIEVSYFQEISNGTLQRRQLPDHGLELANITEAVRWHLAHTDEVAQAVIQGAV